MKLILFDIDGTLVRGGPARAAFRDAMEATFGTAGAVEGHEFSGKTDPQIARELLTGAGIPGPVIEDRFAMLWERYLEALRRLLPAHPMRRLPAVGELLDALDASGGAALGLVTGNIAPGAELKLGSVGLDRRFRVGGFGSDAEERNRLPAVAIARAREHWGHSFDHDAVVIVGDTPRDVACGRHQGCRTVAVATGRFGVPELAACGPDHLFEDFSDVERVVGTLLD